MTLQDELNRAESRWLEAERNGTHYDAVYWRGVMDGIKIQIEKTDRFITFRGETKTVKEFADIYGIPYSCLYARIRNGWSVEDAITTPSKGRKRA